MKIKDRIKSFRRVKASDILPNPKNWRTHPQAQQDALRGVLAEVGIADALLVRETPDGLMLIDGHCRIDAAPDVEWPVLVLDVSEEEADKLLASLDPLAMMAETDQEKIDELLKSVNTDSDALHAMLAGLASQPVIDLPPPPPSVEENQRDIESIKSQRKKDNDGTAIKNDTEKYLVVVYSTREEKEVACHALGLPGDERYVSASFVELKRMGTLRAVQVGNGRNGKAASRKKSGAGG